MRWSHNRKRNVFANNGEKAELTLVAIVFLFLSETELLSWRTRLF